MRVMTLLPSGSWRASGLRFLGRSGLSPVWLTIPTSCPSMSSAGMVHPVPANGGGVQTVSVLLNRQTVQCLTWRKRGGYRFIPFEFTNGSLQSTQCKRHVVSGQFGIRPCGLRGGLRDGSPLRISPCRAYKVHQGCVRFHRS